MGAHFLFVESAISLLLDEEVPVPRYLFDGIANKNYNNDVEKLILERKHQECKRDQSIVIFAIDEERTDLAKIFIETSGYQLKDNFIMHILQSNRELSCIQASLEELWQLAPEKFFTQGNSWDRIKRKVIFCFK